ncbi:RidA family protein [Commensalibacter nepenthis]|uniref:RidA family protein n=1 Tax=Commensalibacter nepenthis TaxID=3043872 RepID=A0ABT6Q6R8_9PROT|nr:RidA family protein [Commensalibacter sp. TBRC 10068]MDI2112579.1 RidA family protein [Commensalibacter sp. TBRC 10068]
MSTIQERLKALNITLPTPAVPVANYLPTVQTGNNLIISGQLPLIDGKLFATGLLGKEVDIEIGAKAAHFCMINILAQAQAAVIDLEKVKRLVRLGGFIASTPEFTQQAVVMNGASDLAVEVLGDAGRHARSAFGVASLPMNACVEVEAWFELK